MHAADPEVLEQQPFRPLPAPVRGQPLDDGAAEAVVTAEDVAHARHEHALAHGAAPGARPRRVRSRGTSVRDGEVEALVVLEHDGKVVPAVDVMHDPRHERGAARQEDVLRVRPPAAGPEQHPAPCRTRTPSTSMLSSCSLGSTRLAVCERYRTAPCSRSMTSAGSPRPAAGERRCGVSAPDCALLLLGQGEGAQAQHLVHLRGIEERRGALRRHLGVVGQDDRRAEHHVARARPPAATATARRWATPRPVVAPTRAGRSGEEGAALHPDHQCAPRRERSGGPPRVPGRLPPGGAVALGPQARHPVRPGDRVGRQEKGRAQRAGLAGEPAPGTPSTDLPPATSTVRCTSPPARPVTAARRSNSRATASSKGRYAVSPASSVATSSKASPARRWTVRRCTEEACPDLDAR